LQSGYGSSESSITIVQWTGKLEVVYSGSFERILYPDAVKLLSELITKYHLCKVVLDGSDSALCKNLKHNYGEMVNYHLLKPEQLDSFIGSPCCAPLICPSTFQRHHQSMVQRTHRIIAEHHIRIDPSFSKLVTSLRTASAKEWNLQKEKMSYSDCLDSLSLSLMAQRFKGELN
jgi:hypothetical protein